MSVLKGQTYPRACCVHLRGPSLCPFHSTIIHIQLCPNFFKSAPNDIKPISNVACLRSEAPMCIPNTPQRTKFWPFRSTVRHFRLMAQYWGKIAQNDIDVFESTLVVNSNVFMWSKVPIWEKVSMYIIHVPNTPQLKCRLFIL